MTLHRVFVALTVGSAAAFSLQGPARLNSPVRAPMGFLTMMADEVPPADEPEDEAPPPAVPEPPPVSTPQAAAGPLASDIWTTSPSVKVQGSTLKTWDIGEEATQRVQLSLKSAGRPIDANVELWHTPSYIPTKFRIYTENGESRPVDAIIETPKHPKTVAVYNTGSMAGQRVESGVLAEPQLATPRPSLPCPHPNPTPACVFTASRESYRAPVL